MQTAHLFTPSQLPMAISHPCVLRNPGVKGNVPPPSTLQTHTQLYALCPMLYALFRDSGAVMRKLLPLRLD